MAYSAERLTKIREFRRAVKDRILESDDPGLVDLAYQGSGDVVHDIATEIDLSDEGGVCLLTGQSGTGKSTALKRLKRRLEESGAMVFYIDLSLVLLMDKRIEISDFLVGVAGALSDQVELNFGSSPGSVGYWDRIKTFLLTEVEFKELGATFAGLSIKTALKENVDFRQRMQAATRSHIPTLVKELHKFVAECVDHVRAVRRDDCIKVVLLVDSVERIRGSRGEEMAVYESVRDLFLHYANHLIIPRLHVVYTVPPYLGMLAPGAVSSLGATLIRRLFSVRVWSKEPNRAPDPSGLRSMLAMLEARFQGWSEIFEPTAINALALSSGGDLRQFLRLINACLVAAARDSIPWPMTVVAIRPIQFAIGNEMAQFPLEHLDWLQQIKRSNRHCLNRESDLPTLAHFLDNQLVLTYRNGQDWYDIHPLLRDFV